LKHHKQEEPGEDLILECHSAQGRTWLRPHISMLFCTKLNQDSFIKK